MAKVEIDVEAMREAGWACGVLARAFAEGFKEGYDDYSFAAAEEDEQKNDPGGQDQQPAPEEKTTISDCRNCWCNQCAKIETCQHIRDGETPDGLRPFPCVGCMEGMRFKPCEEERCKDFEQAASPNYG